MLELKPNVLSKCPLRVNLFGSCTSAGRLFEPAASMTAKVTWKGSFKKIITLVTLVTLNAVLIKAHHLSHFVGPYIIVIKCGPLSSVRKRRIEEKYPRRSDIQQFRNMSREMFIHTCGAVEWNNAKESSTTKAVRACIVLGEVAQSAFACYNFLYFNCKRA